MAATLDQFIGVEKPPDRFPADGFIRQVAIAPHVKDDDFQELGYAAAELKESSYSFSPLNSLRFPSFVPSVATP